MPRFRNGRLPRQAGPAAGPPRGPREERRGARRATCDPGESPRGRRGSWRRFGVSRSSPATDGDDFVSGTIDLFLEEAASGLAGLEAAVGSGDASRVAFFAHGLKGTVRNLGAVGAGDALQELEDAARDGFSPRVAALLPEARKELERFRAYLESGRWKEGAARGGVP